MGLNIFGDVLGRSSDHVSHFSHYFIESKFMFFGSQASGHQAL